MTARRSRHRLAGVVGACCLVLAGCASHGAARQENTAGARACTSLRAVYAQVEARAAISPDDRARAVRLGERAGQPGIRSAARALDRARGAGFEKALTDYALACDAIGNGPNGLAR